MARTGRPRQTACSRCGGPLEELWRGHRGCKPCGRAKDRERLYKVSFETAQRLAKQTTCDTCKQEFPVLDMDHDHRTGVVRGMLCRKCNVFLGRLERNLHLLPTFLEYLQRGK